MFDLTKLPALLTDALHPAHFYLGPALELEWSHVSAAEEPWELFQGRLLEPRFTRQQHTFESWNVFVIDNGVRSGEPLLALKFDPAGHQLYVVRGLHCHVWENYTEAGNVLLSRATTRWLRELVGTLDLTRFTARDPLRSAVADLLLQAVVGTSRLPLSSVESPHPLFTLGRLAYVFQPLPALYAGPIRSPKELIERGLYAGMSRTAQVKLLEMLLRATPPDELADTAVQFADCWMALREVNDLPALLEALFYEVSLSPWTDFVEKTLACVRHLVAAGRLDLDQQADFLCHQLALLSDHLTAYDLITFHHRGANYPDALLLDGLLKECLGLAEAHEHLFQRDATQSELLELVFRSRRTALLRGWLLRRFYEGHLVPDAPTSPGEHTRVLPPPHVRVPEEQIQQTTQRRRRLYADDPLTPGTHALRVLRLSVEDLEHAEERASLGAAVFIDRPLGVFKAPAEPDQTPLLAYYAVSRSTAKRRLEQLLGDPVLAPEPALAARLRQALAEDAGVNGLPISAVPEELRPVVSLADARKVAADFVLVETLPGGVRRFLDRLDLDELGRRFNVRFLGDGSPVLIVRTFLRGVEWEPVLAVYDAQYRKRLELGMRRTDGYERRGRVELPAAGLRVLRYWQEEASELRAIDLSGETFVVGIDRGA